MPKRAAQGSGTIRQRSNGSWEARFTVGRDPGSGRQIQKSVYGKTQKEVRQKMTAALADIDKGTYNSPVKMMVGQWLDEWLNTYKTNVTDSTRHKYETDIRVNIKPYIGCIQLQALTNHDIRKLLNSLASDHSKKSLSCIKGVLHAALEQAYVNGYIVCNPVDKVKELPKAGNAKRTITPLTAKQIDDFLAVIKGSPYEMIFKVTLFTGLRLGEVSGLQWKNISFTDGTITIDHQMKRSKDGVYYFDETKTHLCRKIKPAPAVIGLLKAQKKIQAEKKLKVGSLWNEEPFSDLVFTNDFGKYYGANTLLHNVQRSAEKIGVTGFTFHDLRHTFAVSALLAGDDIYSISKMLGHSDIKITLNTYSHFTDDLRNKASANMETFIQALSNL